VPGPVVAGPPRPRWSSPKEMLLFFGVFVFVSVSGGGLGRSG
jgi:hypothetical protein